MSLLSFYQRLTPLLRPLSGPYSLILEHRRAAYAAGKKLVHRPGCACVSVGNIAWGGTGKTPLVSHLLGWAIERGRKVVVLSRGYGGKPGEQPLLVHADTPAGVCGDEPLMLARAHPKAGVVVFPSRAEAARYAENNLEPDLLLLDDGMQHLAVARDLDLVLLRPADLEEDWGRVIPAGPWREGPSALRAASAFVAKVEPAEFAQLAPAAHKRLAGFGVPLFSFSLEAVGLKPVQADPPASGDCRPSQASTHAAGAGNRPPCGEQSLPRETAVDPGKASMLGGEYVLTAGVGDPAGVERSARGFFGRTPAHSLFFADHYAFTADDLKRMASHGLPVVCAAKDAVKLAPLLAGVSVPFFSLEVRPVWGPALFSDQTFLQWWEGRLRALAPKLFA